MVSDGDLDLGATGSGLDDKAMDKNEENANDESESGEEQDADDDGSSSRSRDSSQHRAVKGKKRRQKKLNSKQRKKQRVVCQLLSLFLSLCSGWIRFHTQILYSNQSTHKEPQAQ